MFYMGLPWGYQDRKIAPREPKRAILGAQDSPEIAPESHLRLSWGCLGAIKRPRYAQDSTKIAPREVHEGTRELSWALPRKHAHAHMHAHTHTQRCRDTDAERHRDTETQQT